jgi:undecaprenyl-diphosphatase
MPLTSLEVMLGMVEGSRQNQSSVRSSLVLLLLVAIIAAAAFIDEFYMANIQPTNVDLFPVWLRSWDLAGFTLLNERLSWPILDPVMMVITQVGSTVFWLFASVILWLGNRRRESVLLAVGILVGGLILLPVKAFLPRARPLVVVSGARVLDIEGGSSFPSGHSKNAFTAFVILGSKWKRLRLPLAVLACLIAVSRVYVGVHWPFDVIVGSIVGWAIGRLTMRYETEIIDGFNRVTKLGI